MWTPKEGAKVNWRRPESSAIVLQTTFTNTRDKFPNTPEAFWARYANGIPVWVEMPSEDNPAGVRAHLLEEGDHAGQSLGAALIRAAADPGNPWGLEPHQTTGDMVLLLHDFMATELGPGRQDPRVLYPAPASPTLRETPLERKLREENQRLRIELQDARADTATALSRISALENRLTTLTLWATSARSLTGFDRAHGRWWLHLKEGVELVLRPLT